MRLLALDTATEACSVAVLTDDACYGVMREVGRGHAEEILAMVDGTLAKAAITLDRVDAIVAGVGPGSFTGVRISVSVAQGLAFGAGVPVIAVSSLEALALQALRPVPWPGWNGLPALGAGVGDVLVCLDARMGEVYWGCFSADPSYGLIARSVPAVGPPADVRVPFGDSSAAGGFAGIGRGFAAYPLLESLPGLVLAPDARDALPDARDMLWLGALRFKAGVLLDPADLAPLYLRDKVALTEVERAAAKQAKTR